MTGYASPLHTNFSTTTSGRRSWPVRQHSDADISHGDVGGIDDAGVAAPQSHHATFPDEDVSEEGARGSPSCSA